MWAMLPDANKWMDGWTSRLTDWKAGALNVHVHIRMKFPVVVTLSVKFILESIHSWSIYHMLKQLVPEIDYSVAVEMLSNVKV